MTYEEPHACTEAGGSESVERADRVNVDWVGAVRTSARSWTCHCERSACCISEDLSCGIAGACVPMVVEWVSIDGCGHPILLDGSR